MNRFGFIDSSGIIKKDKFFGVGLLLINNVGKLIDLLAKNYQTALNTVKANKAEAISRLQAEGKHNEAVKILSKSKRFEMKFDNVRPSTLPYYLRMIEIFFSDISNRFSVMVIDKESDSFDPKYVNDSWEAYTGYSAALVVREMGNLKNDSLCIVVDEITKPNNKTSPLENALQRKINTKITYSKIKGIKHKNLFGALSIESHSNLLMQLSDVLLGAVVYDFKKKNNLASEKTKRKKEPLVQEIRSRLNMQDLAQDFTKHRPLYFSVFEAKWSNKKST